MKLTLNVIKDATHLASSWPQIVNRFPRRSHYVYQCWASREMLPWCLIFSFVCARLSVAIKHFPKPRTEINTPVDLDFDCWCRWTVVTRNFSFSYLRVVESINSLKCHVSRMFVILSSTIFFVCKEDFCLSFEIEIFEVDWQLEGWWWWLLISSRVNEWKMSRTRRFKAKLKVLSALLHALLNIS